MQGMWAQALGRWSARKLNRQVGYHRQRVPTDGSDNVADVVISHACLSMGRGRSGVLTSAIAERCLPSGASPKAAVHVAFLSASCDALAIWQRLPRSRQIGADLSAVFSVSDDEGVYGWGEREGAGYVRVCSWARTGERGGDAGAAADSMGERGRA